MNANYITIIKISQLCACQHLVKSISALPRFILFYRQFCAKWIPFETPDFLFKLNDKLKECAKHFNEIIL